MGRYVNPGNESFEGIRSSEYVDKTGLIGLVNDAIGSLGKLMCVSRPRRFGKSLAASMLCAYYSAGCDSHALFDDLEIADNPSYERHLNAYNVIRLDMTDVLYRSDDVPATAAKLVIEDLRDEFPDAQTADDLITSLSNVVDFTGRRFVVVIDEWDAPIREQDERRTRAYVDFLRSLFKSLTFTGDCIAAAYLTGILPIKKYNTQSALSDFEEYTMVRPWRFAPYVGFTEDEVRDLCERHALSFDEMQRWYDGYELPEVGHIYSPFSVMRAVKNRAFGSYWTSTAAYDSLLTYIERDFYGLQEMVGQLVAGDRLPVDPSSFQNDLREVASSDDVLTVLVHLGYLAYDQESGTVRIPNEEVRQEFVRTLRRGSNRTIVQMVHDADQLLQDTLDMDADAVAAAVEKAHDSRLGPRWYNDEQALWFAVKLAYLTAIDKFAEIEELPTGRGLADIVYLPKRYSRMPALVIELKWNEPADSAIAQIRARNYPKVLKDFGGEILLVGITYDKDSKVHAARIELVEKD